jgi:hypothetical protein
MAGYDGMNPEFASRLQQMIAASGGRVTINSGYRSVEKQQQLWEAALKKYGDPEVADNWVARPGKSHHNKGIAADLGFADAAARQWVHANAAKFGLFFPMEWEPWHIEPMGLNANADPGAYTTPPTGFENPASKVVAEDPHDPDVQFKRLMGVMFHGEQPDGADSPGMDSPSQEAMASPQVPGPGTEIEQQLTEASTAGGTTGGA